jgi:eukaryotic-like serine/threonine-protein kinase
MDPQVGQVINNKYRLLRLIGDGGMGSVFEAKHELLGTTVALKFLHGALARRKGLVERFLQEAQVSARIKSPHVVSVSDVDRTSDGLAYMVMEYVEGETLQTLYEKLYQDGERLTYGDAFDIVLQILEGVSAAHALGIVHRDLKPDNVMFTSDGKDGRLVKILDFGIAKLKASGEVDRGLTRPGVVMGTPEYMAPEQAFSADRVDARADVFSLGVMFFEMLAGRRPVGGDNAHAIAAQYLEGTIARLVDLSPAVAPKLADAVHKAMGAKPDDRFESIDAFRDAIAPYAPDGAGTSASVVKSTPDEPAVPKTLPPNEAFPDGAPAQSAVGDSDVHANSTPNGDSAAPGGDTGTAEMNAVGAAPSPLRAGTAPMPDGAIEAQMAMRANATPNVSDSGGSTQIGEPFTPPAYSHEPAAAGPAMSPGPSPVAPGPVAAPYGGPAPRPGKKKGASIFAILLIAASVSAAVVGGVYVAHQAGAKEAEDDDPIDVSSPPPVTVVRPTPPGPQPPAIQPPTIQPPSVPPPVAQPPPKPTPKPTTQPPPKPTTPPPVQPTTQPPFVLPSAIPPIIPPGIFGPPPSQPPPAQPPPPTGKKKPGGIFKKSGSTQSTPATPGTTTSTEVPPGTPATKPVIKRRIPFPFQKKKDSTSSSPSKANPVLIPRINPKRR